MVIEAPNARTGVCLDLEEAAAVMAQSWRENNEQPLKYTPEFLQSYLSCPGHLPAIVSALHEAGKLAAFVFGFPRSAKLNGREIQLLLMTFFTVAPEFKARRLGVQIWADCVNRARASGYDGVIYYCVEGNRSNHVTAAGCRAAGCEPHRIMEIPYLMRLLRPGKDDLDASLTGAEPDLNAFEAAAAKILARVPLARTWTSAEARWQCVERLNAILVTSGNASSFGALAGYQMRIADQRGTKCVFLDDILWEDLAADARRDLVKAFIARCAKSAQVVVVPLLRYFDSEPFLQAGFRRSTRVLNAYLAFWDNTPVDGIPAMYMDVI
jgi:hypothetical protein